MEKVVERGNLKKALQADTTKDADEKTLYDRLSLKQKNDYKNID